MKSEAVANAVTSEVELLPPESDADCITHMANCFQDFPSGVWNGRTWRGSQGKAFQIEHIGPLINQLVQGW